MTEKEVTSQILEKSIEDVVNTNSIFYQETADNLSNTQINLLLAISNDNEQLFSVETMKKYKLGTPRNISKNKGVLENKDIIEFYVNNKPSFVDPFFEIWFKKFFYNNNY